MEANFKEKKRKLLLQISELVSYVEPWQVVWNRLDTKALVVGYYQQEDTLYCLYVNDEQEIQHIVMQSPNELGVLRKMYRDLKAIAKLQSL